jgi:hypothetical protein
MSTRVLQCKCVIVHTGFGGCLPESSCVYASAAAYKRDRAFDPDCHETGPGMIVDIHHTTIADLASLNDCADDIARDCHFKSEAIDYLNEYIFN